MVCTAAFPEDDFPFVFLNEDNKIIAHYGPPIGCKQMLSLLNLAFPKMWTLRSEELGLTPNTIASGDGAHIDIIVSFPGDPIDYVTLPMFDDDAPNEEEEYFGGVKIELYNFLTKYRWTAVRQARGLYLLKQNS